MTTMVTVTVPHKPHVGNKMQLVRRWSATGNETVIRDPMPIDETIIEHVWGDCELVVREVLVGE